MATPAEQSVVIDPSARTLRGQLGLTAWSALEDLLLEARPHAQSTVAVQASARALAVRLGVSKDTAAAALRRLAAAGLVCRESRRDSRGVFDRTVYFLDLDRAARAGVTTRVVDAPTRPRRRNESPGVQGELFEPEPAVRP